MATPPALVIVDSGATGALDLVLLLSAVREALADVGVRGVPDGEIIETFGRDTVTAFDDLVAGRGHGCPTAVRAARIFAARVVRDLAERRHPDALEAGAGLRRLQAAGVPAVLVSDLPTPVVDALLLRHGWQRLLRAGLSVDQVEADRPAPDLIEAAMARVGVRDGQQVAHVAAHHAHLQAGRVAGVGCSVAIGWTSAAPAGASLADLVAPDLGAAVDRLLTAWGSRRDNRGARSSGTALGAVRLGQGPATR